ncbi:MAG: DUF4145 domain-containing protein [Nostoc sp. ChiSLP01]|nr:hypothetical protein [Nostoc sp. CmiSLP01]MDZ8287830.1 hypothetical protein [Nostoc sp. ChiSLP01]
MTENNQEVRGLFDGKSGDSLFIKPFHKFFRENELPELFKKVEGMNDHRLLAIITALLIENRVDKVLSLFLPRYSKLLKASDFTFSMKINLLEALNFIPPSITTSAHCLRKIRNEFAHNLSKVDFSSINEQLKRSLRSLCEDAYRGFEKPVPGEKPLFDAFKQLSFFCIAGLEIYTVNIKVLRDEISKEDFINNLDQLINDMNHTIIDHIMSQSPANTEIQGNLLIERHERGVVKISSVEQPAENI